MGIATEYNTELALRNISEFKNGNRKREECIPEDMKAGQVHEFLKKGQRIYCLVEEIPLTETKGNQQTSNPLASVIILEATHLLLNNEPCTKGRYKIIEVFKDDKIHFNSCRKID